MTTEFTAAENNMNRRDQLHADIEYAKQRLYDITATYKGRKMRRRTRELIECAIGVVNKAQQSISNNKI